MIPSLTLGIAGPPLPALGLGCMGMSEFYGASDDDRSLAVLHGAADRGVRMFDTADVYGNGHNEELLARFLRESAQDMFVATKFGIRKAPGTYARSIDNSAAYVRASCETSLRRLSRDRIDLYYVHRLENGRPVEEVMQVLSELVQAGKIGHVGLSEVSAATLRRAHAVHPVSAVQSEYSLTTRDVESEVLPACRDLGVAFVAYSPLGRGLLSGTLDRGSLSEDDFRRNAPRFAEGALADNLARLDTLRALADRHDVTPAQIALAWVLAKGVFAIPGTRHLDYLEQNVAAAGIALSEPDTASLDAAYPSGTFSGERYTAEGMKGVNA